MKKKLKIKKNEKIVLNSKFKYLFKNLFFVILLFKKI